MHLYEISPVRVNSSSINMLKVEIVRDIRVILLKSSKSWNHLYLSRVLHTVNETGSLFVNVSVLSYRVRPGEG